MSAPDDPTRDRGDADESGERGRDGRQPDDRQPDRGERGGPQPDEGPRDDEQRIAWQADADERRGRESDRRRRATEAPLAGAPFAGTRGERDHASAPRADRETDVVERRRILERRDLHRREIGGADPLDPTFAPDVPITGLQRLVRRLRRHAAFGLAPALAPALLFVPLGFLLGPPGLDILSIRVLRHLDPVISVSLAALGMFVGLALGRRPHWEPRLFIAASVEALVTVLVVLLTLLVLLHAWRLPLAVPAFVIALLLAVSASASSAVAGTRPGTAHALASRIADLDDVLPIAVGAVAIALVTHDGAWTAVGLLIATICLGLAVGLIGWLLIERAHSVAERGVFVAGSLALAGGASAYLSLSPLLAGLAAGMFWNWSPGRTDAIVRQDLQKFQHPLVVLMLLAAGASLEFSLPALWLFAPFVVFRLAGKLAGGWLASRLTPGLAPADLGAYLLAPGLLGIAFALNAHQHLPLADGVALLTAVVAGTLAGEGVALLVTPVEGPAPDAPGGSDGMGGNTVGGRDIEGLTFDGDVIEGRR